MVAYISRIDRVFMAAAHPLRIRIIEMLLGGSITISKLSSNFPVTRQAISKHLKILKRGDVINTLYSGRECRITLKTESLQSIDKWLAKYRRYWKERLFLLKNIAEKEERKFKKKFLR